MKRKILALLIFALGGIIGLIVGWVWVSQVSLASFRAEYFNVNAYAFRDDLEIIELLEQQGSYTEEVKEAYDRVFFRRLMLLSVVSPEAIPDNPNFVGSIAEGMCELLEYRKSNPIGDDKLPDVTSRVNTYLNEIEPHILEWIEARQSTLGGEGCTIGGKGMKCPLKDKSKCLRPD